MAQLFFPANIYSLLSGTPLVGELCAHRDPTHNRYKRALNVPNTAVTSESTSTVIPYASTRALPERLGCPRHVTHFLIKDRSNRRRRD